MHGRGNGRGQVQDDQGEARMVRHDHAERAVTPLPEHLPRIETLVDIADKSCPCCAGALHVIGEDRAERLDIVPAQLRVLVVRRPAAPARTWWSRPRRRPG
jgi:transposase